MKIILCGCIFPVEFQQGLCLVAVNCQTIVVIQRRNCLKGSLKRGKGVAACLEALAELIFQHCGKAYDFYPADRLRSKSVGKHFFSLALHSGSNLSHYIAELFLSVGLLAHPFGEGRLFLTRSSDDVKLAESEFHSLPLLPAVGRTGVFARILNLHLRVCKHLLKHHVLTHRAGCDTDVVLLNLELQLRGSLETGCPSRVAHNHGIIPFLNAFQRYLQMVFRRKWHILRRIICRIVVLVRIYTEH